MSLRARERRDAAKLAADKAAKLAKKKNPSLPKKVAEQLAKFDKVLEELEQRVSELELQSETAKKGEPV